MKKFKDLIIGATFYGLSRYIQDPDNTMLVEPTAILGSEFVDSFNEQGGMVHNTRSPFGKIFEKELADNGFIDRNGVIYQAPALFLLCGHLEKCHENILMNTKVLTVKHDEQYIKVSIFNSDGKQEVLAERVIDTTSEGALYNHTGLTDAAKSLNVIIDKPIEDGNTIYNPLSGVYVYKFFVDLEDDYITARKKLQDFWRSGGGSDSKIILTANTFAYHIPPANFEICSGYHRIPSCGFGSLLNAVDEGGMVSE